MKKKKSKQYKKIWVTKQKTNCKNDQKRKQAIREKLDDKAK